MGRDYHCFRNCFTKQVVKLLVCAKDGVHLKWCFDGECEEDWAKVDTEENPSFNTSHCLQVFKFHLGNLSEETKGLWVLGIFRDSQVKREGESSFYFLGFYLGSNFGLYSKGDFLTKMVEMGNEGLIEAFSKDLSHLLSLSLSQVHTTGHPLSLLSSHHRPPS